MYSMIGWLVQSSIARMILFGWTQWVRLKYRRKGFAFLARILANLPLSLNHKIYHNFLLSSIAEDEYCANRLLRDYWTNGLETLYELLIEMPHSGIDWERIRSVNIEAIEEARRAGKGVIIYASHQSNFFWAYAYLSERYPCQTVVTSSSPELQPIYYMFRDLGYDGLDYDQTPPTKLFHTLSAHLRQNGVVFLLGDFYRRNFPESQLFGLPNRAPAGAFKLAQMNESPILPLWIKRDHEGTIELTIADPIEQPTRNKLSRTIEDAIRRCPEQWFYWFQLDERWREASELKRSEELLTDDWIATTNLEKP